MSYYCQINFKKMKPDEIIPFFQTLKAETVKALDKIAEAEFHCVPFFRNSLSLPDTFRDLNPQDIDNAQNWAINSVFKFRYFYDTEFELLGVYGVPDAVKPLFDKTVEFQNSCDQDYEREHWEGVGEFERIFDKWATANDAVTKEKYAAYCNESFDDAYGGEKQAKKLQYWRRSFAYKEIWKRYENTLYDDERAIYLSLFSNDDFLSARAFIIRCFEHAKEWLKEFEDG